MEFKNSCKAPISGETIDLSEVNDPVFSNKILGDGVAIRPNENIVSSPADGILNLRHTKKMSVTPLADIFPFSYSPPLCHVSFDRSSHRSHLSNKKKA